MSSSSDTLTRSNLKTPKAAAIAGIAFSVLLATIIFLFRVSIPADPGEPGAWLDADTTTVAVALNLIPIAGVAFLWFIGVVRDRLGPLEDRFFATVFFGSGLLFLAMLFSGGAAIGAIILTFAEQPKQMLSSTAFHLARAMAYNIANVYAIKMAAVFMFSSSVVVLHTSVAPRWVAILGFGLALTLLFGSYYTSWSIVVMPVWVLIISICFLADVYKRRGSGSLLES
jgi:hypothetical protein